MKFKNKSIFNLIEIFTNSPKKIASTINTETHCAQKHIHDFYCDAEKPYIG
ncbi:hypothetical protein [Winogradskyella sp. 4-2091]|uniref:hypothetical protein n=1 Tax=Winogradskyella sp. 4-2091 TaxID=3381659 RepID=UPI003892882E